MTYNNIKSHEKPGLYPLSRRCIFGKTKVGAGRGQTGSPLTLYGLIMVFINTFIASLLAAVFIEISKWEIKEENKFS